MRGRKRGVPGADGPSSMQAGYNGGPSITLTAALGAMIDSAPIAAMGAMRTLKDGAANVLLNVGDNISQVIRSGVADGATAIGMVIDTVVALANSGAKLISVQNAGVEKFYVDASGNIVPSVNGAINLGSGPNRWANVTSQHLTAYVDVTAQVSTALLGTASAPFAAMNARRSFAKGTALVASDFALSAGWGTTASVGTISGSDAAFQLMVTSAGTGQGANPTITLTFHDLTWTTVPIFHVTNEAATGTGLTLSTRVTSTATATTLVITANGTPAANDTITIRGLGLGT